jgi:hypothetical protein
MTQPPTAHETRPEPPAHAAPAAHEPAASKAASFNEPNAPASSPESSQPHRERKTAVAVAIVLAALLFLGTSGLLYLRWVTMREPTCIFIVDSPPAMRGAEVTVDGVKLLHPHTATIGTGERFALPFYLDYGVYSVRVTLNGATVVDTQVDLTPKDPYQKINLAQFPAPTGASTRRKTTMPSSDEPDSPAIPPLSLPRETP